jgi:hypothetical protein
MTRLRIPLLLVFYGRSRVVHKAGKCARRRSASRVVARTDGGFRFCARCFPAARRIRAASPANQQDDDDHDVDDSSSESESEEGSGDSAENEPSGFDSGEDEDGYSREFEVADDEAERGLAAVQPRSVRG